MWHMDLICGLSYLWCAWWFHLSFLRTSVYAAPRFHLLWDGRKSYEFFWGVILCIQNIPYHQGVIHGSGSWFIFQLVFIFWKTDMFYLSTGFKFIQWSSSKYPSLTEKPLPDPPILQIPRFLWCSVPKIVFVYLRTAWDPHATNSRDSLHNKRSHRFLEVEYPILLTVLYKGCHSPHFSACFQPDYFEIVAESAYIRFMSSLAHFLFIQVYIP